MQLFIETKKLVKIEKNYTAKILQNLMIIEKEKLYSDLKLPSLHKYLVKELGYCDAEATVRVNATRFMLKSKTAARQISKGNISLTNACEANKALAKVKDQKIIEKVVGQAVNTSTRKFKEEIAKTLKQERREVLILGEMMLQQFDRLRKKYGDLSTYELIAVMLEKELKTPDKPKQVRRGQNVTPRGRTLTRKVKHMVYKQECSHCKACYNLEYDHKFKFSHGGSSEASNLQMLCRSCNQRKEIKARDLGFFV